MASTPPETIASRITDRKRRWGFRQQGLETTGRSRRRLLESSAPPSRNNRRIDPDVAIIQTKLGSYQHHGTGNPLAVRSPTTPKDLAVRNLAKIIQTGALGLARTDDDGSQPKLKTERGSHSGAFWTARVRLAGSYGWTGLILPENADSSKPFPIKKATWFVVENEEELGQLQSLLKASSSDAKLWRSVKNRLVTVSQLAERLRRY